MNKFAIYVNKPNASQCGYLTEDGRLSSWNADARSFETEEQAEKVMEEKGWLHSISVLPFAITAYTCFKLCH